MHPLISNGLIILGLILLMYLLHLYRNYRRMKQIEWMYKVSKEVADEIKDFESLPINERISRSNKRLKSRIPDSNGKR